MKPSHNITILLTAALLFTSCKPKVVDVKPDEPTDPEKHETITLGGGCYWCVEAVFQQLDGVISATSGFMGGHIPNPSSEEVYSQTSGHIEVVQVVFDPNIISTPEILKWFWKAHNPTDPRGQGVDKGKIYMSNIFAHSPKQRELAEASKK
ncbi:peptide-methionine (S)-S-oxide reductase MsrA, partial [Akkermansiaceae bacterium]|nr:peptide-methionine (S)-S-oxide reductase MsrA [Akkermansiaceae bacterium]